MKIAMFHELDFGGAKRAVMEFAKRLKKNYLVDLYYVDEAEDISATQTFNNIFYYPFYPKVWKGNDWKIRLYKDTVELIRLYALHRRVAKSIDEKKYDFVFVNPSKYTQAPFLLSLFKTKSIYYCQEPLRIVYDPYVSDVSMIRFPKNIYEFINRKIRKWIDLKNVKSASFVLVNSKFSKDFIERSYYIKAEVCYLGVDANSFKPINTVKSTDILFIGNSEGYKLLNEALSLLKIKPKVYALFREKNKLNVSDKQLVKIYNESKIVIALNRNEPFGLIPLEAMACGVPVVAVNEGGYRESVVDGESGYLFPRNAQILSDKISWLLAHPKQLVLLGKQGREQVLTKWTWEKSAKRLAGIIENFS